MKKRTVRNILLGFILAAVLLIASHLEYKQVLEDAASQEDIREAAAEIEFYEYHEKNNY